MNKSDLLFALTLEELRCLAGWAEQHETHRCGEHWSGHDSDVCRRLGDEILEAFEEKRDRSKTE